MDDPLLLLRIPKQRMCILDNKRRCRGVLVQRPVLKFSKDRQSLRTGGSLRHPLNSPNQQPKVAHYEAKRPRDPAISCSVCERLTEVFPSREDLPFTRDLSPNRGRSLLCLAEFVDWFPGPGVVARLSKTVLAHSAAGCGERGFDRVRVGLERTAMALARPGHGGLGFPFLFRAHRQCLAWIPPSLKNDEQRRLRRTVDKPG